MKVKEFYDLKEVSDILAESIKIQSGNWFRSMLKKLKVNPSHKLEWIEIGITSKDEKLILNIDKLSDDYSQLGLSFNGEIKPLNTSFKEFIERTKY